jgi:hypothetical protein
VEVQVIGSELNKNGGNTMNWKMRILAMLFLLLPAYAGNAASSDPANYSGVHRTHDMSTSWKIQKQPGAITIKGIVQNTFHYSIHELQLWAVFVDENGKPVGKEVAFEGPNVMELDQKVPFSVTIPVTSSVTPKNIRLEYRFCLALADSLCTYEKFMLPANGTT